MTDTTDSRGTQVSPDETSDPSWLFAKIREAGTHTLIYGFGSALQSALGFILIPLYTHYYVSDAFGALALIQLCGTLAGVVFYLGASSALARSYFDYDTARERRLVISTAFWITMAGAAMQIGLGWALSGQVAQWVLGDRRYAPHIVVAMVGSALTFVNALFYLLLRYERKSVQVVALNLGSLVVTTALIWYLLAVPKLGVMAPLLGGCLAQGAMAAALAVMSRGQIVLGWSRRELDLQLRFGLASLSTGLLYYVLDSVDRLLIRHYGTLGDVGVYSLGYRIGSALTPLFIQPFSQIWAPMRMEYRAHSATAGLLSHVLTYFMLIGLFLTVVASVYARDILLVLARRAEYLTAYRVVPFVMLGALFYGSVNILDYGLWIERKVHYYLGIFGVALLLKVVANVVLLPRYGYMAAAVTTLGSYGFVAVAVFAVANRLYPMQVEARLWPALGSAVLVSTAGLWATWGGVSAAMVRASLVVGLAVYWYFSILRDNERRGMLALARSGFRGDARA